MKIKIRYNGRTSGDWIEIYLEEDLFYEGYPWIQIYLLEERLRELGYDVEVDDEVSFKKF